MPIWWKWAANTYGNGMHWKRCTDKLNVLALLFSITVNMDLILVVTHDEVMNPCEPSPCGNNAVCKERNGAGSCSCLPEYIGNPYEGCRPECIYSSDCPSHRACIRNRCQDPCPGTCGQNAFCQVINHSPTCNCISGYTGNPMSYCNVIPSFERKINLIFRPNLLDSMYFSRERWNKPLWTLALWS